NTASKGAGVYHDMAESYFTHCTIANNGDGNTQMAGGLYAGGGSKIYSYNIFANNTAVQFSDIQTFGPVVPDHNLVRITSGYEGAGATDVLGQDPRLGALQNLGGTTSVY